VLLDLDIKVQGQLKYTFCVDNIIMSFNMFTMLTEALFLIMMEICVVENCKNPQFKKKTNINKN